MLNTYIDNHPNPSDGILTIRNIEEIKLSIIQSSIVELKRNTTFGMSKNENKKKIHY